MDAALARGRAVVEALPEGEAAVARAGAAAVPRGGGGGGGRGAAAAAPASKAAAVSSSPAAELGERWVGKHGYFGCTVSFLKLDVVVHSLCRVSSPIASPICVAPFIFC